MVQVEDLTTGLGRSSCAGSVYKPSKYNLKKHHSSRHKENFFNFYNSAYLPLMKRFGNKENEGERVKSETKQKFATDKRILTDKKIAYFYLF